jgi:DNA repair protein RecO (recombination protein O)
MIVKTHGIVLNYLKYGDSSIIVRIFTEEYGFKSLLVNGIRSQRSKKSIGHFQPFSLLELVLYLKETRDLQRVSDFKSYHPLHNLHQDFIKSTITMFLTELLTKLLVQEEQKNEDLYLFLESSIITLNQMEESVENFHIQFLLKLGPYLGFAIEDFSTLFSSIDQIVPALENEELVTELIGSPYGSHSIISKDSRNHLLDAILNYYNHHANIQKPKSLEVLRSVLG